MNDNVPVVSQRTITIVDFAVTAAYGGAGTALDYSDPSRFAQMTNLTSDDDVWYQIDGGAWTQLLQANAIQFAIDFSTQTLTMKLGEHTDGSVEMRVKIFGVPSGLYADENDVSALPDDAVGALVNDGSGNLSWGAMPDGVVSGATGQVAVFDGANALTGDAGLTWDAFAQALTVGTGLVFGTTPLTLNEKGDDSCALFSPGGAALEISKDGTTNIVTVGRLAAGYGIGSQTGNALAIFGASGVEFTTTAGLVVDLDDTGFYPFSGPIDLGLDGFPWNIGRINQLKSTPVALADLGAAATAGAGTRAFISDGLTLGTWGDVAVDGGVIVKPVWSNGVAWLNG